MLLISFLTRSRQLVRQLVAEVTKRNEKRVHLSSDKVSPCLTGIHLKYFLRSFFPSSALHVNKDTLFAAGFFVVLWERRCEDRVTGRGQRGSLSRR